MNLKMLNNYHTVVTDCWRFFRNNSSPCDDEGYWRKLLKDADDLNARHGRVKFSSDLIDLVLTEIEEIYQREQKI